MGFSHGYGCSFLLGMRFRLLTCWMVGGVYTPQLSIDLYLFTNMHVLSPQANARPAEPRNKKLEKYLGDTQGNAMSHSPPILVCPLASAHCIQNENCPLDQFNFTNSLQISSNINAPSRHILGYQVSVCLTRIPFLMACCIECT